QRLEAGVGGVRAAILVRLIPLDLARQVFGFAICSGEHQYAVPVSGVPSGLAPDAAHLVLPGQVVLDQLNKAQTALASDVVPQLTSESERGPTRPCHVTDDEHRDPIAPENAARRLE